MDQHESNISIQQMIDAINHKDGTFLVISDGTIMDKTGAFWRGMVITNDTIGNTSFCWPYTKDNMCFCRVATFDEAQDLRYKLEEYYELHV